ncbi:hypothetical protein RN001_008512 [Aquatica leii]|uniref:S1 motif domain-containing protein n=1 Tax=Aquatica leii TaxID=1421715 RepID=A0AAN7S9Q1_9COLE|nr:hypothetical protein RN001_008512 [Aquatica leii]
MDIEDCFPRGGIKKIKEKIFTNETPHSFKSGKRKRSYSESNIIATKRQRITDITYGKIEEDMLVLACVRSITAMSIEVELPGKMCGKIKITSISDCLTKILEEKIENDDIDKETPKLETLFRIGQFIPTRILKKNFTKVGTKLVLSTNPSDIHRGWSNANLVKGCCIWVAVELELEHGYQLNVGIGSCKVFLPFKNIEKNIKYVIGQPLYTIIKKCTVDSDVSIVVVSTLEKDMSQVVPNDNVDLLRLIPGSCLNFTVTNVLGNGLKGSFSKHTGYVFEAYLDISHEDISFIKYNHGDNFKAYLLYVQPDTKCAYLSLRGMNSSRIVEFENGTRLDCEVFKNVPQGVYLKLPNDNVGFVAYKRIKKDAKSYTVGSQNSVIVLDYRRFECLYVCTFAKYEENLNVKEVKKSFEIGELVTGKVTRVSKNGVVVSFGKSKGFIQNIHLNEDVNVKVGGTVQAKVWNVNDDGVYLTVKKMLLESDVCLKSIKDAVAGEQYPGVVVKKGVKGLLVVFYGDVRGMLMKNYLIRVFGPSAYDIFEEGEVIFPIVFKIEEILTLGFSVPNKPKPKHSSIVIGDFVTGTVTNVCANGLEVEAGPKNTHGFIPTSHLSSCLCLTSLLLKTYKVGDVIEDLLCVSGIKTSVLSIREAKAYRKNNLKVLSMSDVTVGTIIRCFFLKSFENRVRVSAPLIPETKILHLYENDLDKGTMNSYEFQQTIVTKVTKFNLEKQIIKITAKSEEISKWNYDDVLDYLEQYLEDLSRIQNRLSDEFKMSRLCLGQKAQCTVKSVNNEQCLVLLEDCVQGVVFRQHLERNIKVGDSVEAVVVWKDFVENRVVLSLKRDVFDYLKAQDTNDVKLGDTITGTVIFLTPEFIISATNTKQILIVPVLKSNYYLKVRKYRMFQTINVIVTRKVDTIFIGVDKFVLKLLEDAKEAFTNKTSPVKRYEEPIKRTTFDNSKQQIEEDTLTHNASVILPGVQGFFVDEVVSKSESSSDEEIEESDNNKKKKLTAAERTELIRQAEERIREKEIELADGTAEPQSEEQFERLVTGKPNSSELWAKYIAYCVSNAEIHKARNIAKAALKRIDLNKTEDRYNIWITLLNLENSYGDKESFNSVFNEAVRCNDDLQIYLDVINLLASSEKYTEMNEKIKKVKSKHKQNPKMWTTLALVYYKCGQLRDARSIQSSALNTIEKKSNHIDLIVQFAIMEFNYGERHHAEALFETILQLNPKRVDVWSTYVDQMIKKENIEGARRILERAVSQSIPAKKMKTLFKKYKELEIKYGDEESVAHVIDLARQYLGDK